MNAMTLEEIINAAVEKRVAELIDDAVGGFGCHGVRGVVDALVQKLAEKEAGKYKDVLVAEIKKRLEHNIKEFSVRADIRFE